MAPTPYWEGNYPEEILGCNDDMTVSTLSGPGSVSENTKRGSRIKNSQELTGKASTNDVKANLSTNATIAELTKMKKPLHKAEIGGRSSCFAPVVRVPSSDVVGVIQNKSDKDHPMNSNGNKKFSQLLQRWQTREERNVNAIPQNKTFEYRFRPIIADDEKYQVYDIDKPIPEVSQVKKQKIHKMPVVEISFFDDESIDTLSSMGYDGSEHDLEAIFKYEIYEVDDYIVDEENYFDGKELSINLQSFVSISFVHKQ